MKAILLLLCLFLMSPAWSRDEVDAGKMARDIAQYQTGLTFPNEGVVGTTITNIIRYKSLHPAAQLGKIEATLAEISLRHDNPDIREKALVATYILNDPELLAYVRTEFYDNADQFIEILALGSQLELAPGGTGDTLFLNMLSD